MVTKRQKYAEKKPSAVCWQTPLVCAKSTLSHDDQPVRGRMEGLFKLCTESFCLSRRSH